ncbi:MAG TPA: C4-type zinc ribbon domain-containing protein [Dehalococcoidia bacterium]
MVLTRLMTRIGDLWQLQEIDSALDARRASLEDADARLGESEDIAAARVVLDERAAAVRHAEGTQKDVELQADDLKSKIGPAEQKLYSGSIKNPKELSDLQADIDQLKRQLSATEDRDLEALTAVEAAEAERRIAAAEVDALESAWRDEQTELRDRVARLRSEIADYEEQREERLEYVDSSLLPTYDQLRRAHQGRAVAKLDRNLCLGCRISLPVSTVNKARAGNALVQCPNCERILYA